MTYMCDRCGAPIGDRVSRVGMELEISDSLRGMGGQKQLCGACSERFVWWWQEPGFDATFLPPEAADVG